MANSFLKSLPSHKKRRKLRHRERRSDSQSEHHSQKSAEHTGVNRTNDLATQSTNVRLEVQETLEENNEDESLLSETESCVPGTEFQYPIATLKTNKPSQDEETIGMYSPLSGRAPILGDCKTALDSVEKEERAGDRGAAAAGETNNERVRINLPALNGKKPSVDTAGQSDKNNQLIRFRADDVDGRLGTNQQSKRASVRAATDKSAILDRPDFTVDNTTNNHPSNETSSNTTGEQKTVNRHIRAEINEMTDDKKGERKISSGRNTFGVTDATTAAHQKCGQTPDNRYKAIKEAQKVKTEWVLASTDVQTCIDEIQAAPNASEVDFFSDLDLASFQTTLRKFKSYLVSLSQPTSKQALELNKLPQSEWVFAIFERGIDVSHCNVCFICDMIEHIACGIDDLEGDATKLREFAECVEQAFGFNQHFDQDEAEGRHVFASISKTKEGGSKVMFKREASNLKQVAADPCKEQTINALPPHLDEVSKLFEQYSNHKIQLLLLQLNSTHSTLAKTREGAIQLQKTALDLQDQLQHARIDTEEAESRQTELEAALQKQKYEFEKRLESAERVKEHYKRLLEQKEKELAEAKGTVRQKAMMPDTVHSMTNARLPSKREKSKTLPEGDRYDRHSSKHPRHGADDASRDAKRNRISIEPPECVRSSGKEKDIIHESPPVLPPLKSDDYRQRRQNETNGQRSGQRENENDRNPLGSLTVNSFHRHPINDTARRDMNQPISTRVNQNESNRGPSGGRPIKATSTSKMSSYSSKQQAQITNPYAKRNDFDQYVYKYKEVVRGKTARAALPGHECEECRKFNDAIYAQTGADMPGREQMIKECSRHRSRFVPDFTPAGYWDMDFIDEK